MTAIAGRCYIELTLPEDSSTPRMTLFDSRHMIVLCVDISWIKALNLVHALHEVPDFDLVQDDESAHAVMESLESAAEWVVKEFAITHVPTTQSPE